MRPKLPKGSCCSANCEPAGDIWCYLGLKMTGFLMFGDMSNGNYRLSDCLPNNLNWLFLWLGYAFSFLHGISVNFVVGLLFPSLLSMQLHRFMGCMQPWTTLHSWKAGDRMVGIHVRNHGQEWHAPARLWFTCNAVQLYRRYNFFLARMDHKDIVLSLDRAFDFTLVTSLCSKLNGLNLSGSLGDQLYNFHNLKQL